MALTLAGFLLLAVLLGFGARRGSRSLSAELVTTTGERTAFLAELGWETDPASETAQEIHIPERFSQVYERYNELQRQQGYDLTPFRGRDCTLYTYAVTNWPEPGQEVTADLYILNDRVIAGDIHSTDLHGFMIGLK